MTRPFALVLTLIAFHPVTVSADDDAANENRELQALSNYVGIWDVAFNSKDAPFSNGSYTSKWVLDDKFVEQTGDLTAVFVPKDIQVKALMTYDQNKKAFRKWTFLSNGRALESSGTWDPKNRCMTWVSTYHDDLSITTIKTTTTETFLDSGVQEWSKVSEKPNKEIIGQSKGTASRH